MTSTRYELAKCTFEVLTDGDTFLGLGAISIAGTPVRSGRLPISVATQTFSGLELERLELLGVVQGEGELRIRTRAHFRPMLTKMMRDHSFDPIYSTGDWDTPAAEGNGELDIVLRPADEMICETPFAGFSYAYAYHSTTTPIFWLLDRASWELDGDILGATVYTQSSCSAPVATFAQETAWTTEGIIHFADCNSNTNPVMTHNLPRWASHGSFDFQYKGDHTLLGIFERVDLIRSLIMREAGKEELKTFDKHIFDQTLDYTTAAKKILLNTTPKSVTDQQNLWTWTQDIVYARARAEFGLREEPLTPWLSWNYWVGWTLDSYYRDLLPAAYAIGIKGLFIDGVNRNDYSEYHGYPEGWSNMCNGQEYEISAKVGGPPAMKRFIDECVENGITRAYSWTNNDQSYLSANTLHHPEWFVRMEDSRLHYGGAYTNCFNIWSFAKEEPRNYWVECLKTIKRETGLSGYLFDSFYNLGFMPVDYTDCTPQTFWRQTLEALKELQDADVHFRIESFGPFGEVCHGCPKEYNLENLFACYKSTMGTGYTTIPTGQETPQSAPWPVADYYRILAYMANPGHPLFYDGVRIDKLFTDEHKRILAEYYANQSAMERRFLQEDGQSVLWHDAAGECATLWNFADREVSLPGTVVDLSTGETLPVAEHYALQALHTYSLTGAPLPTRVTETVAAMR